MSDTTATIIEVIRENVVADIIDAKPERPPRVLKTEPYKPKPEPTKAEVLQAMDEVLGNSKAKPAKEWTIWVSCYKVGYASPHGNNSMNFLFQDRFADKLDRFDIVKLDDETWVFKPDPKGLRTLHVRGGRARVTVLDDVEPFRSTPVPLVEVDGVWMAHIPLDARLPVRDDAGHQKRIATLAARRATITAAAAAKKAATTRNRVEAQQARRERERERERPVTASLDQRQAQEKLVQPSRLAQAMREFAAPIEQPAVPNRSPPQGFEPGPLIVGELKAALQLIRNIEAATPYRISRIRNENGSTMLVWKAPNIV